MILGETVHSFLMGGIDGRVGFTNTATHKDEYYGYEKY